MVPFSQEFCQAQYRSLIAPRLVEEEQASLHEEVVAKHKRAEAINAQRSHQLETRVMTLMTFIDVGAQMRKTPVCTPASLALGSTNALALRGIGKVAHCCALCGFT